MNTALRAFQRALDVTGHNITNVNTVGYSRQVAQINEADPTLFTSGATGFFMGNGVTAETVSRIQDHFLAMRRIQATSENGRLGALSDGLNSVQALVLEPGGASIGDALDQFFNSWSSLGSNPSDSAARMQVQQAGMTLASRIRGMYSNLQDSLKYNQAQIGGAIQEAQELTRSIADINAQVLRQQTPGAQPNDLFDARDQMIQRLSEIMPVKVVPNENGTVALFSGQLTLVDQTGAKTIPTTYDAAAGTLGDGTNPFPMPTGRLAGLFQTAQRATVYERQLDSLANTLRTQFNSIHSTGTNGLGATGQNFFGDVPAGGIQTGAADFDVDPAIKADPEAIATGVSGDPGDGGLALSMSQLRDSQIAAFGGKTFGGFYAGLVATIGQDVATTKNMADTSTAVIAQIDQQIQSVSGVSLDDEMANMLRFQRSYQAAAKALSVFDQTTEDLINMIR